MKQSGLWQRKLEGQTHMELHDADPKDGAVGIDPFSGNPVNILLLRNNIQDANQACKGRAGRCLLRRGEHRAPLFQEIKEMIGWGDKGGGTAGGQRGMELAIQHCLPLFLTITWTREIF